MLKVRIFSILLLFSLNSYATLFDDLFFQGYNINTWGNYHVTNTHSIAAPDNTYGIFLGFRDPNNYGDIDAINTSITMIQSGLLKSSNSKILLDSNVTIESIKSTIAGFNLKDGDKLLFYYSGHGHTNYSWGEEYERSNIDLNPFNNQDIDEGEKTINKSDEYLYWSTKGVFISDDAIFNILKYTMI